MGKKERIALGGMKKPAAALARLPLVRGVGNNVASWIRDLLTRSKELLDQCIDPVGREDGKPPSDRALEILRATFLAQFGKPQLPSSPDD